MTGHHWFAEAAANRIWGYFFARGIVDPVDDFRATNPATHPALLQALANDFKEQGYDLRRLMRRIVQSTTYQLSSPHNDSNRHDVVNYSRALPRPLDAEVLLDAVSEVTGTPEQFGSQPLGTRATQLIVPGNSGSQFLEVYGAPLRAAVDERDNRENLRQALHMLVGDTYTKKLAQPGGRIDRLLGQGRTDREIIEEFYLAALTRLPTPEEIQALEQGVAASDSRRRGLEDMAWALLNTREFVDNH
jgi:hypothetical protein